MCFVAILLLSRLLWYVVCKSLTILCHTVVYLFSFSYSLATMYLVNKDVYYH